jgi:hypothetical protein
MENNNEKQDQAAEVKEYFAKRAQRHRVVKTTYTPSGQILDWIPIESQNPDGGIATPPPPSEHIATQDASVSAATFELHDQKVDRGPEGTVPVLRKDLSKLKTNKTLHQYLSKKGREGRRLTQKKSNHDPADPGPADPNPAGYLHATSSESITCYGCQGTLNVWTPALEGGDGHSIMQTGMQNYDNPQLQSLEAGWTVDPLLNGDSLPHVFTYYTNNGYTQDGDNKGGYNTEVDGWIQYDHNVFPGALINGSSTQGGTQFTITIKYQLYQGNWWFQVQGIWLGYYPAKLFFGNKRGAVTLGSHADWLGFWGEVYSDLRPETLTTTDMGSGYKAEAGWTHACYQRNLLAQTAAGGGLTNHNGSASAEDSALYDIILSMNSGTSWGSYFYAGGIKSRRHRVFNSNIFAEVIFILFGIINDGGGAYIDAQGHIHIVGPGDPGPLVTELLISLSSYKMAKNIGSREGVEMQRLALMSMSNIIENELKGLNQSGFSQVG